MHRPTFFRPPRDMDDARRTLTSPEIHNGHPAVIQDAWGFMAEARGLRIDWSRLTPAHVIEVAPAAAPVNPVDAARLGAIPRIHRALFSRGLTPKGAA